MTIFEQALHIFRKDARHLRLEIAGVLFLTLLMILTGVQTWEGVQENGWARDGFGPLDALLPLTWCLLIARSIQTEALPGDRHFWLTRPYSRTGLVLSKLLFIVTFVNLPFLLAQAAIVALDGLPLFSHLGGLLWMQVLLSAFLLLPVAAVAVLTRNLAQFLPAVVMTGGILALLAGARDRNEIEDLSWIRLSLGLALAAMIASLIVWRQYRLRRAGNTALVALGTSIAGIIIYLSFPQSAAFAIQSRWIGAPNQQFAMHLGEPGPRKTSAAMLNQYTQMIELPLTVSGLDPRDLQVTSSDMTFKTLSGATRRARSTVKATDRMLIQHASVDRNFYEAARNSPVSVRIEYSLTQFANANSTELPLDGRDAYIPNLGQCGTVVNDDRRNFVCRSAFRTPGPFVSDRLGQKDPHQTWFDVYSPFPAQMHIHPIFAQDYALTGEGVDELAPIAPERPANIVVRKRVAYFRYVLDIPDVRLADFAISDQ